MQCYYHIIDILKFVEIRYGFDSPIRNGVLVKVHVSQRLLVLPCLAILRKQRHRGPKSSIRRSTCTTEREEFWRVHAPVCKLEHLALVTLSC